MGSLLPKKFSFQQSSINDVKGLNDMKRVFGDFVMEFNKWYPKLYDHIEAGGASTSNWDFKESTAADVAAGNAKAVGNALIKHKTKGTKHEFEAT